jgi:predicted acyltransferase
MKSTPQTRIDAIDILRGLARAFMLLVDNPGSWLAVYAPFLHADWHGLTSTDLVFPFFLFVAVRRWPAHLKVK